MRLARQLAFMRAVVGDAPLRRREIVKALTCGALLALQADLRRGRLGQCVALRLRIVPRGGDAGQKKRRCSRWLLIVSICEPAYLHGFVTARRFRAAGDRAART